MSWVVDTCVVLDILENDDDFGILSARLLESRMAEGLMICPISFIELAPAFGGSMVEQKKFLEQAGIEYRGGWSSADTETAHQAWHHHVVARRQGTARKRPLADVFIGAYASNRTGLITRNGADFHKDFPDLAILQP